MRTTLSSILAALLLSPVAVVFALPASEASPQGADELEPTVLQEAMEALNQGQRGLRKLLREPGANRAKILDTLIGMERAIVTAVGELPPRPEGMSDAEHALWHVDYKRTLTSLLLQVLTMEQAALENADEALNEAYAEIGRIKKAAHEKFQEE